MRAVPDLQTLFRSLPACMHPLALRAQHPSIDMACTLSVTLSDGIAAAHTARAMAELTRLTSVSLTVSGYIFPAPLRTFRRILEYAEAAPCPISLNVARTLPLRSEAAARALAASMPRLGHLSRLVVSGGSLLPGLAMKRPLFATLAGHLSALHTLDLACCRGGPFDVQALAATLAALRALRALSLAGLSVHDTGWPMLREVLAPAGLTELSLSDCNLGDAFLLCKPCSSAWDCTAVEVATGVEQHTCTQIVGGVTTHKFGHCGQGQTAPCGSDAFRALRVLDISHNRLWVFPGELYCQIWSLPSLESLSIGSQRHGHNIVPPLAMLSKPPSFNLLALDLSHLPLANHLPLLRAALRSHAGLTSLSMHSAGLQPRCTHDFADMLRELRNLRQLRLGYNALGETEGCTALPVALATLTSLELLSLPQCSLDSQNVLRLTEHLTALTRLRAVDLSGPHLSTDDAETLTAWAATLPMLHTLRMTSAIVQLPHNTPASAPDSSSPDRE
eukprot:jgi/Ulvmu1/10446/UM062_0043.1